jgi:hypothetical protein
MMRRQITVCLFLAFVFSAFPLGAEPKVNCEVTLISKHSLLVNFSWRVTVYADKSWEGCDLKISFRDKAGKEIHLVREVIKWWATMSIQEMIFAMPRPGSYENGYHARLLF